MLVGVLTHIYKMITNETPTKHRTLIYLAFFYNQDQVQGNQPYKKNNKTKVFKIHRPAIKTL